MPQYTTRVDVARRAVIRGFKPDSPPGYEEDEMDPAVA